MAVLLCERGQLPQFTTSTRAKSEGRQPLWIGDYRDSGFVRWPGSEVSSDALLTLSTSVCAAHSIPFLTFVLFETENEAL